MLDSRFRLQRTSHKHTLHLCRATLTVRTPDLQVPALQWTIGISDTRLRDIFCSQTVWRQFVSKKQFKKQAIVLINKVERQLIICHKLAENKSLSERSISNRQSLGPKVSKEPCADNRNCRWVWSARFGQTRTCKYKFKSISIYVELHIHWVAS